MLWLTKSCKIVQGTGSSSVVAEDETDQIIKRWLLESGVSDDEISFEAFQVKQASLEPQFLNYRYTMLPWDKMEKWILSGAGASERN